MKYEEEPRPNIEQHYYIRSLIEGQEKRTADRNYHREKEKEREERNKLIDDASKAEMKDFWCDKCQEDFIQPSLKQVEQDWSNSKQSIAFYKTVHDCGNWCIRYITDKNKDPYWTDSRKVRIDQGTHFADLIQPYQTNFNLLYGKK